MIDQPTNRLLRWQELKERIPLSRSNVYRLMAEGTFPRPINLGARSVAWFESEITNGFKSGWISEMETEIVMIDLVAKAQGKSGNIPIYPNSNGCYLYKKQYRTLGQLAKIGGIADSTLHSRFARGTYTTVENAVHAPVKGEHRNKKAR